MITVEFRQFAVIPENDVSGKFSIRYFYEAWKPGFPNLNAYGKSLDEAIAALFNKWGTS